MKRYVSREGNVPSRALALKNARRRARGQLRPSRRPPRPAPPTAEGEGR